MNGIVQPKSLDETWQFMEQISNMVLELQKQLFEMRQELGAFRRDMHADITKEVIREFGQRQEMIDGILTDIVVQKECFYDKGYITRDEINKKYQELKDKANG